MPPLRTGYRERRLMDLADYINEWLRNNDRTPTWLARKAGWSHSYMLRLVNRKRAYTPSVEKLDSLAGAMDVSVHTLVDILLSAKNFSERGD